MGEKKDDGIKKTSSSENLTNQFDSQLKINSQKRSRSGSDTVDEGDVKKLSRSNSGNDISEEEATTVLSKRDRIIELPQPPSFGREGRQTRLKVNCFRVHCKTKEISQYNIVFEPALPDDSSVRKQAIINKHYDQLRNIFGFFIFDNMRLWSLKKLKDDDIVIQDEEHSMSFRFIKSLTMNNAPFDEFTQIIHIIFSKATHTSNLVKIGRNYYDKNTLGNEEFLLRRDRIRLFRGYAMNIEQTLDGLSLTVDVSHRVISTDSIGGFIDSLEDTQPSGNTAGRRGGGGGRGRQDQGHQYRGSTRGSSRDSYGTSSGSDDRVRSNSKELMSKAEQEIVGRCVITTYRMRNWRIDAIDWTQNIDSKFTWRKKSGETIQISYRDYFLENYRLELKNTRYGMLVNLPKINNNKVRRNKGPDRFVLPPEACYMTGLSPKMKADFGLMKRIRDIVSLRPNKRYECITDIVTQVSKSLDSHSSSDDKSDSSEDKNEDYLKIDIEPRGLEIKGRILNDVEVRIKTDGKVMNAKAKDLMRYWGRAGVVNQNQHLVRRWVVFYESRYENQSRSLINELMNSAKQYSMLKSPLDSFEVNVKNTRNSDNVFTTWKEEIEKRIKQISKLELIVCLIPGHFNSDYVYSAVKTATLIHETKLIPSQCIKAQRFDQRNSRALRSVISSTLKQILTKRGNIPWIVNYTLNKGTKFNPFNQSTMVVGIDVNHDNKRNRSTAGICVSGDSKFCRYDTYVSISAAGQENISGAEKSMVKSIMSFFKDNGKLPQHVIVYRDGVSNSELLKTLKTEVKAFRDAFKYKKVLSLAKGPYEPKLTFVVVQKRVSLRIFNTRLDSGDPQTVVDSGIVSSRFWDFYMLTTKPPPGKTSRPTRYIVVYDDYGMTNDDLQAFTNQLCHTYYNFPGPIRVPAPVQIAHQVAYLFGSIISEQKEDMLFTPKCKGKAYYM